MVAEAQSTGDISTMLNLLTESSAMSDIDYIDRSIGRLRVMYYMFLYNLHTRPKDLIDMVDGILYIECMQHFQQKEMAKIQEKNRNGTRPR